MPASARNERGGRISTARPRSVKKPLLTILAGTFMGESTSADTRDARREQLPSTLRSMSSCEVLRQLKLHVSARVVGPIERARALVSSGAIEERADVSRPCRTRPEPDRLTSATGRSWFAGRALASVRTVGEPLNHLRSPRGGPPARPPEGRAPTSATGGGRGERPRAIGALLERAAPRPGRAATPQGLG